MPHTQHLHGITQYLNLQQLHHIALKHLHDIATMFSASPFESEWTMNRSNFSCCCIITWSFQLFAWGSRANFCTFVQMLAVWCLLHQRHEAPVPLVHEAPELTFVSSGASCTILQATEVCGLQECAGHKLLAFRFLQARSLFWPARICRPEQIGFYIPAVSA